MTAVVTDTDIFVQFFPLNSQLHHFEYDNRLTPPSASAAPSTALPTAALADDAAATACALAAWAVLLASFALLSAVEEFLLDRSWRSGASVAIIVHDTVLSR